MTNLEAVKLLIGTSAPVADDRLRGLLELAGVNPDANYDANDQTSRCAIYGTAVGEIKGAIDGGVKSISQGDYSITYDREGAKSRLLWLADESGCPGLVDKVAARPKIRDKSNLW